MRTTTIVLLSIEIPVTVENDDWSPISKIHNRAVAEAVSCVRDEMTSQFKFVGAPVVKKVLVTE